MLMWQICFVSCNGDDISASKMSQLIHSHLPPVPGSTVFTLRVSSEAYFSLQ